LPATLLQAARRQGFTAVHDRLQVFAEDLQQERREQRPGRLVIFLVDTSDSMGEGTSTRMAAAKGAVLALLRQAHWNRDRIGLVVAGGDGARVMLRPTRSVDLARRRLRQLPLGGATPLAAGLLESWNLIRQGRLRQPECPSLLVILSDGAANVPLLPGRDIRRELLDLTQAIRRDRIGSLVIASGGPAAGRALLQALAESLAARFLDLAEPRPRDLAEAVVGAVP
jgi:magnesium chelatase subunit D